MFGFQACVLCLAALALTDIVFVSFRSSLTVARNGKLAMLLIMAIHTALVFVQMGLIMRVALSTYWVAAGLFCHCAKCLRGVVPLWLLRLFFTCFPCLYRIYVVPGHLDAQQGAALREDRAVSARRPWNDGGYGAVVVLDLVVVLAYVLAVLHLLSYLSEKSLYPPYNQALVQTPVWPPPLLDPSCMWTVAGASLPPQPPSPSAPATSTVETSASAAHAPTTTTPSAMSRSTELTASMGTRPLSAGASWQRRATQELHARQIWQTMWESGVLPAEMSSQMTGPGTTTSQNTSLMGVGRAGAFAGTGGHVHFHPRTDSVNLCHQSTSIFAPDNAVGSASSRARHRGSERDSESESDSLHSGDSRHHHRASSHTRGPLSTYRSAAGAGAGAGGRGRRGSFPTMQGPVPSRSYAPPSTTRTQLGRPSPTIVSTDADSTVMGPTTTTNNNHNVVASAPSWVVSPNNPFFTYDTSGGHQRRRSSHVASALLPAPSELTTTSTSNAPPTTRTRGSSTSTTTGSAWLRRASSLDSGLPTRSVTLTTAAAPSKARPSGSGDGDKGLGLKRFFAFHRNSGRRHSSSVVQTNAAHVQTSQTRTLGTVPGVEALSTTAAGLTDARATSPTNRVGSPTVASSPPSPTTTTTPASPFGFAFPTSLSYEASEVRRARASVVAPTAAYAVDTPEIVITPPPPPLPPPNRPSTARPRAAVPAARDLPEVLVRSGGGEARESLRGSAGTRKDHSSLLFRDDPSVLELHSGMIGARIGTRPSDSASATQLPRAAGAGRLLNATQDVAVRSTTMLPLEMQQDASMDSSYPRPSMPPPRPPPMS